MHSNLTIVYTTFANYKEGYDQRYNATNVTLDDKIMLSRIQGFIQKKYYLDTLQNPSVGMYEKIKLIEENDLVPNMRVTAPNLGIHELFDNW